MTGYGDARGTADALSFRIEVRSVNNRHLKLTLRAPEPYNLLEAEFEKVVRRFVRRGTVLVQVHLDRSHRAEDFRVSATALASYVKQIAAARVALPDSERPSLESLCAQVLALPGVCAEPASGGGAAESEWPVIERGLTEALSRMQRMREDEGARMAQELRDHRAQIGRFLGDVRARQPAVVQAYRGRLRERVQSLLADTSIHVTDDDLAREIAVYAERSDIAEEVVRLESHLQQFQEVLDGNEDGPGRKLEFVTQEMGREVNTMGSKAGDVAISRLVVEIKAVLEKIRELLQNVE
jgi:uncharacterized protein (TIGR00255 family)